MARAAKSRTLARWLRVLPTSIWVMALAVCLVGGRYFWILAQRPAHERELAGTYGSLTSFSGAPKSDKTGKRITYVANADVGLGIFLCDVTTGQKRNVRELWANSDLNFPDVRVWPWSPDDSAFVYSAFVYSDGRRIFISDAQTGKSTATVDLPGIPSDLAWVNPKVMVCFIEGKLRRLDRKPDGTWTAQEIQIGDLVLRSGEDAVAVTASEAAPGADVDNAVDGDETTSWFSGKTDHPVWLQYQFSGPAWAITRYKLTSSSDDPTTDPIDWQLLGSNDGTNWIVLDNQANETFSSRRQTKQYDFLNETPYWFYRLNVTATAGGAGNGARLAEFQLFSRNVSALASASSESWGIQDVAAAFDGLAGTKWFDNNYPAPVWLQYQFGGGAAWALSEYSLTSGDDMPERDPRDWEFQASNDGKNWITLDNQAGQSFAARKQTKSYLVNNNTPYRIYRLNITASQGTGQGVQLSELDLGWDKLSREIVNSDDGLVLRSTNAMVASAVDMGHEAGADNVHDQNITTSWFSGKTRGPVWLQYEFNDVPWAIRQYKLVSSTADANADPRDWQLLASNDGKAWAVLDRQTNQVFTSRRQAKRYDIASEAPYRFYRLNITANATRDAGGVRLAKFQLWSDDAPTATSAGALANASPNPGAIASGDSRRGLFLPGTDPLANPFSLMALDDQTVVWGQGNSVWSLNLDDNSLRRLLDLKTAMPAGTTLSSLSFSKETGQFLLNCNTWGADSLWRFDPNYASSAPEKIADKFSSAVWINGGHGGGWLSRQNNCLMVQRDPASAPVQIVPGATIDGITVSPDGRQLFLLGTTQDEPSAGIWQYDFASAQLKCVVPYGNQLSAYAKRENFSKASLQTASGQTLTYYILPPMNADQHPHRKYPLVIGDTLFHSVLGSHGPWIPAVAACDAYVVIVDRPGWFDGIKNWGDDVMAVYNEVTKSLPIDKDRVFLFGASAETPSMSKCVEETPELWKGAIFLNPSVLPDFSKLPIHQRHPRILISAGGEENEAKRFEKYQTDALRYGDLVDFTIHPGEGHHLMGNTAQLERTRAIMRFIFEE